MERPMQYAYEVYKQKSFSKAAEKLYISQPALSAIIKKLEDSLGVPLFDRSTKPVSLTPAGEYYIHCAEEITAVETGMQQYFDDDLRSGLAGERYITPVMLEERFNSFKGAAWGFDPNQEKTEIPRLPNRCADIENLYLVGNGAHPGPFLPGVLQGAEIVHREIINSRTAVPPAIRIPQIFFTNPI